VSFEVSDVLELSCVLLPPLHAIMKIEAVIVRAIKNFFI
jgi:hypothetical protein